MHAPEFWTTGAGPWPALLSPLAWLYDAGGRLERRFARPRQAGVPVICIGNLTAGGTGKTPLAIALGRGLAAAGHRPGFLTRGYGGRAPGPLRVDPAVHDASQVGDEALLLARAAPTWIAKKRRWALEPMAEAGIDVMVLDDGYQDPGLTHDLDLVVVDGETGFGNGCVIPAGPLRESLGSGLARADGAIVMGADHAHVAKAIRAARPGVPVIAARLAPGADAAALKGRRVYAFAGIGRPAKFEATLQEIGAELQGFEAFADHHRYTAEEIARLLGTAVAADAIPVTTAKDFVRLPAEARDRVTVVEVEAVFAEQAALTALLNGIFSPSAAPGAPDRGG